jgi:alginate O-acetyltransferase complex protein AlgI
VLFNTYSFLFVFLPVTFAVYWGVRGARDRQWVIFLASYVFYAVWSVKFAILMLATTSVDYFTARRIEASPDARTKRLWLTLSMVSNLSVLGVFKYYDFFATSVDDIAGAPLLPLLRLALPIGISFYTFESMSYTIDVYRGEVPALRQFIDYGHFVTMFPRLVAGPIVRYKDMAHSLANVPDTLATVHAVEAVQFFTIGLVKKVFIADILASRLVDPLFASRAPLSMAEGWLAALGYTGQLYFDFSGYSDMAVGLALLFGFRLPRNFNLPYASANVSEFWRRWHISLSTWLRDYLYIPLGGNRGSRAHTARNLFLTMLLGGVWHGANWTFLVWGAIHGGALVVYSYVVRPSGLTSRLPRPASVACSFLVVVVAWVMFRAATIHDAGSMYAAMLGFHGLGLQTLHGHLRVLLLLGVVLALSFSVDTYDLVQTRVRTRWAVLHAVLMLACILRLSVPSPFLYFQF